MNSPLPYKAAVVPVGLSGWRAAVVVTAYMPGPQDVVVFVVPVLFDSREAAEAMARKSAREYATAAQMMEVLP